MHTHTHAQFSDWPMHPVCMQVRDNVSWMHDMEAVIESDEPAKSVSGAEEQLGRHEQHRVSARGRVHSLLSHIGSTIYLYYILVLYIGTIYILALYIGTIYWHYIWVLYIGMHST